MSSSSSMTPFTRGHHTTKRFNNAARLKTATHYPIITTPIISNPDINNNSNNPGAVFAHYEHGHSDSLLEILNDLRLSRQLCDITIIVDQHEYPCHKNVLSAASPYFRAMFTTSEMSESSQPTVTLNGIDSDAMSELIEYAYTSEITICENNVQSLLSAANLLMMQSVRDACSSFFERFLDETNAIGINCFAELHGTQELTKKAKRFVLKKFSQVAQQDEWLHISAQKIVEFIKEDDLRVSSEDEVYEACLRWLNHAPEQRKADFHLILQYIRLAFVSPYILMDRVASCKIVQEDAICRELLHEALQFHLLIDRRSEMSTTNSRLKPRTCSELTETLVFLGGEDERVVVRGVEIYNPERDEWKKLCCLPYAVSKHAIVASGASTLYLCGGDYPNGRPSSEVWKYEQKLDTWIQLSDMLTPRSELGLALIDGYIYACGGTNGEVRLNTIERYSIADNKWTLIASMQIGMTSPACCSLNGYLYITGGAVLEEGDAVDLVMRFDPRKIEWSNDIAPMRIARSGSAAVVLKRKIYVCGGLQSNTENTNLAEAYDPTINQWQFIAPMREHRYRPGAAVVNEKIYVCGGQDEQPGKYHESVECYSIETDQWTIITELICGRSFLACAMLLLKWSDILWEHVCEGETNSLPDIG
ncbi:unnamed protein product [Rotaria sordida]|uniref:BTB domain-containing protein n=1 Tax=Rotaria sordida TaxID=392033 RepID=A0A814DC53_9BILA|nr:unnamed protein product [Rotaria sordida]CAF0955098.1 unnamed protein product [Rotaria sordida]CAF1163777.1 unnamed protein product [Rotaria sordida]CAF3509197.1 unnamed protein product [Rotaria sordida]